MDQDTFAYLYAYQKYKTSSIHHPIASLSSQDQIRTVEMNDLSSKASKKRIEELRKFRRHSSKKGSRNKTTSKSSSEKNELNLLLRTNRALDVNLDDLDKSLDWLTN